MNLYRTLFYSFWMTLLVWAIFSWPLPLYLTKAVPSAAHPTPAYVEKAQPGDYLQLMYYCWLMGDFLSGKTPLFRNIYEFNTGDVDERFQPDTYYLPFSIVFSALAPFTGRAFAWNVTGFISLWMTVFFSWALARRYVNNEWLAGISALISIIIPYRWVNLFGGSPAGWAFLYVPLIMLGVDISVRERKIAGALLAACGIIGAAWGDQHVFFFGVLALPFWIVFCAIFKYEELRLLNKHMLIKLALCLTIIFSAVAFALIFPHLMKKVVHLVTGKAPIEWAILPRSYHEVTNYSPEWRGYFGNQNLPINYQIYIGFIIPAFCFVGYISAVLNLFKRRKDAKLFFVALTLLGMAIGVVLLLAPGTRGPFKGIFMNFARDVIPFYNLIRQPAKILCLFPTFMVVACAICFYSITILRECKDKFWLDYGFRYFLPLLVLLFSMFDYQRHVQPTLAILPEKSASYEKLLADALRHKNNQPHSIIVPLWPGDSHYSSFYQYFSSLYRVPMINGYNPFIKKGYFEEIFRAFESINQGILSQEQIEKLQQKGINYVIVYSMIFPEKVSPFPVSYTLNNLRMNSAMSSIADDEGIYVFAINNTNTTTASINHLPFYAPTRMWEAEKISKSFAVQKDESCSAGAFAILNDKLHYLHSPYQRFVADDLIYWAIRIKGNGSLVAMELQRYSTNIIATLQVQNTNWHWIRVSPLKSNEFLERSIKLELIEGEVCVDMVALRADNFGEPEVDKISFVPATLICNGYFVIGREGEALFSPENGANHLALKGPAIPLKTGTYRIKASFLPDNAGKAVEVYVPAQPSCADNINGYLGDISSMPIHIKANTPFEFFIKYNGRDKIIIKEFFIAFQEE